MSDISKGKCRFFHFVKPINFIFTIMNSKPVNPEKAASTPNNRRGKLTYADETDPQIKKWIIQTIEQVTGRKKLEKVYNDIYDMELGPGEVWEVALEKLQVQVQYDFNQLLKAPKEGPLVFIANHPFGVVDGLILGLLASRIRQEFVVLVNEILAREPLLADHFLPIDFRENKAAARTNIETRRKTMEHLKAGGMLAIFPAGGVATSSRLWGKAQDLTWKRFVVKVIQSTQSTVVPLYIHGQNSRLFQVASHLSMNLRLSLLLHEIRNKAGRVIDIKIGEPITYDQLAQIKDRQALLDHLRAMTELLAER